MSFYDFVTKKKKDRRLEKINEKTEKRKKMLLVL